MGCRPSEAWPKGNGSGGSDREKKEEKEGLIVGRIRLRSIKFRSDWVCSDFAKIVRRRDCREINQAVRASILFGTSAGLVMRDKTSRGVLVVLGGGV